MSGNPSASLKQRIVRYHLDPRELKVNPHAYPYLWKRNIFWHLVKASLLGLVGWELWGFITRRRRERMLDFYKEYCVAVGLDQNTFVEGGLQDRREQTINFTSRERKEEILERVKELWAEQAS